MPLGSKRLFQKQLKRIHKFYDFTMHCYALERTHLRGRIEAGDLARDSHIQSEHGSIDHYHVGALLEQTKKTSVV